MRPTSLFGIGALGLARGALVAVCFFLSACAPTSPVLVGQARPAIAPAQVMIYSTPPPVFEEVATLYASSHSAFLPGGERQIDRLIERFKIEAAHLGANGVILEEFSDAQTMSLGTGVGSQTYTHNADVNVGVGGSFGIFRKTGRARAIYVPPG